MADGGTHPTRIAFTTNWPDFRMLAGLLSVARRKHWQLLNLDHVGTTVFPLAAVDGLIANITDQVEPEVRRRIERWRCPLVNLSQTVYPWMRGPVAWVTHDDYAIGRMAAEHLAQRGYQHLAYYHNHHGELTRLHGGPRSRGFTEAGVAAGCQVHTLAGSALHDAADLMQTLARLPRPLAVMCENDYQASALCQFCHDYSILVPAELAIIGVEDDPYICPSNVPALTSVDVDREGLGMAAAETMAGLLEQRLAGDSVLIPPRTVVARATTGRCASPDPSLQQALAYIDEHFQDGIGVDEVVAAVGQSRASLYRSFQQHFGHSIAVEIAQRRIQRCCEVLSGSDTSLEEIALATGYSSAQHLRRSFQRVKGESPRRFRERTRQASREFDQDLYRRFHGQQALNRVLAEAKSAPKR
ncbi:MAG: substrate-binding domain-containing protein [Planctomycetota bacterium]|jgi:LacI family transcriptional regulator|nr:substrate-binding domain-containing protein [Planctomycetota bacterium]